MQSYLKLLEEVLTVGSDCPQRATVDGQPVTARTLPGGHILHDVSRGFPLLTTKKVPLGLVASELWLFLQGKHRKEDLHAFNNHIWDEWELLGQKKGEEDTNELGRIYGVQWRDWTNHRRIVAHGNNFVMERQPVDQILNLLAMLEKNPWDRRMVVTAWNPGEIHLMALPACHMIWQVVCTPLDPEDPKDAVIRARLHLCLTMRSADMMLGVPFNIASYALLLLLLAKHANMMPGTLSVTLNNAHIYEHHLDAAREQIRRQPGILPEVSIPDRSDGSAFHILDWTPDQFTVTGYKPQAAIPLKVAV